MTQSSFPALLTFPQSRKVLNLVTYSGHDPSGHAPSDLAQEAIYAFSPNRSTMGGTSYLIHRPHDSILIDCPPWDDDTQACLDQCSNLRWLVFTHRGGMGQLSQIKQIRERYSCTLVVQEQEAYLLPDIPVTSFQQELQLSAHTTVLWTPGHTPGSSCVHHTMVSSEGTPGGSHGILFTGRHLLPNREGQLGPLRVAKTFHWYRQLRSVQRLLDSLSPDTLHLGLPGANTGFLRKNRAVADVYQQLAQLDLEALRRVQPPF